MDEMYSCSPVLALAITVRRTLSPAFSLPSSAMALLPLTGCVISSPLTLTVAVLAAVSTDTTSPWALIAFSLALAWWVVPAACTAVTPLANAKASSNDSLFMRDLLL
ncbi:MAG: hypothetical protein DMF82_09135 [Acidobacteria bacterium]|nr:MAG: hypothetical protein DMF82_09135 [Acidobacteriota bacterium]